MLTSLIVSLVDLSRRLAWPLIIAILLLTAWMGLYVVGHFKINTDVNQLLASDLPFRLREAEIEKAFPQNVDNLVIVVDADTPDNADYAATALTDKLKVMTDRFSYVEQPDGIPFFHKNAFLFLSKEELNRTLGDLVRAQPMLGALAGDPNLRGLFDMITNMARGVLHGDIDYKQVDKPFEALGETLDAEVRSQYKPLGWQGLMSSRKASDNDLRKIIITKPVLDYHALQPGKVAADIIRKTVQDLNLVPGNGIHVRLTGSVALNDEEFASVTEGTKTATIWSAVLVIVILWLALRSARLIVPILISLAVGLVITTAAALMFVGSLNLISVAFAVMFIGIAVDFGIQFGVRYRAQHFVEPDHAKAMTRTARIVALPLAMAAGSTALGFLSFMPTAYRGVSELGFIAGIGMIIAFVLTIIFLPALFSVFNPPPERERIGFRWMLPFDRAIDANRKSIVFLALILAVCAGLMCLKLRFDFDPLDLKNPRTESVSTLFDIMSDRNSSPYTIEILSPSLADANATADKLKALPEVDHTMTLSDFIPDNQDAKLTMVSDARTLLDPTFNPASIQHAPTDEQILTSMNQAAAVLHQVGADHVSAERFATAIDGIIARHSHGMIQHVNDDLVNVILARLELVREALKADQHITLDSITDDLRRDWVTPDGKALIKVYPKDDPRDGHTLDAFADAVQRIAPDASGPTISIRESGRTVAGAFIQAGCYAIVTIMLMALLMLRNLRDVLILIAPLILAGILTLATIVVIGLPLNFANIIALPLLLSLGVSYAIYFVTYRRSGMADPLQSSMARAVLFSASTALVAFGSLGFSSHPGTASMGKLLTVALLYSLTCTFFVLPALLGSPKVDKQTKK